MNVERHANNSILSTYYSYSFFKPELKKIVCQSYLANCTTISQNMAALTQAVITSLRPMRFEHPRLRLVRH